MIDLTEPLTDAQADEICEFLAGRVVGLGLTVPAILALEMHRPLTHLASHALVAISPILAPVLGIDSIGSFGRLIHHPGGVDKLITSIEKHSDTKEKEAV